MRGVENSLSRIQDRSWEIPNRVSIEVTTKCQLECIYCGRDKNKMRDLEIDMLKVYERQLKGVQEIVFCGIGESFCYPYLYDALEILKDKEISIITNGAVKIDFTRLNKYKNVKLLIFSIDSSDSEMMRKICGNYNWEQLLENLENLRRYPNIVGAINATFNEYNYGGIPDIVKFAADHYLLAINCGLPIGGEKFVTDHRAIIKANVEKARVLAEKKGIVFNPFYRLLCEKGGNLNANIDIDGYVYPCCGGYNAGRTLGNILEESIEIIWKKGMAEPHATSHMCNACSLVENLRVLEGSIG